MRTPSGPIAPATNGPSVGRFARQAHAGAVDVAQLFGNAESRQARPVGAEGVGFEDLRAGLDVLLVDLADHVGLRDRFSSSKQRLMNTPRE